MPATRPRWWSGSRPIGAAGRGIGCGWLPGGGGQPVGGQPVSGAPHHLARQIRSRRCPNVGRSGPRCPPPSPAGEERLGAGRGGQGAGSGQLDRPGHGSAGGAAMPWPRHPARWMADRANRIVGSMLVCKLSGCDVATCHTRRPVSSPPSPPFEPLAGSNGQPTATIRHGDWVLRPAGPWTPAVHALLRHLERVGFPAAPRVVGDGHDDQGREVLSWIPGRIAHPRPYTEEQIWQVGQLLGALHQATATFQAPPEAVWQPCTLHRRAPDTVISHCNVGPWHVILDQGRPVGLIDWSLAGPTDPL